MGCGVVEARTGMELVAFQDQEVEVVVMLNNREDNRLGGNVEHVQELFDYEMKIALESSNIKHPNLVEDVASTTNQLL
jgi:hypothetical protein